MTWPLDSKHYYPKSLSGGGDRTANDYRDAWRKQWPRNYGPRMTPEEELAYLDERVAAEERGETVPY